MDIGVYLNEECDQNCTSISWGALHPSNSTSKVIYVKNIGTVPITLSMTTDDWIPINAHEYLTLMWDLQDKILEPGQSSPATLTLLVDSVIDNLASFNFNIIISGSE